MGCISSSSRISVNAANIQESWQEAKGQETVLAALARIDEEIVTCEKSCPAQRLTVVSAELDSIHLEIKELEEMSKVTTNADSYAKTMHQIFVNLDLYRRPMLAAENEDFVANVNRKEMRRLELSWLRIRENDLQRERRVLHARILRIRALYMQMQQLLECLWGDSKRIWSTMEEAAERAQAMRDALALVTVRLRAAAEYAQTALRLLDEALPTWKLASIGKSGWERTLANAESCQLLVRARLAERGARRVLTAQAAPRAARAIRLSLDYAFTDTMHDHKYQRATETFLQFKEALIELVSSIHQVLLNNSENLTLAANDFKECRRQLRAARVNDIVRRGLADLQYDQKALKSLKTQQLATD